MKRINRLMLVLIGIALPLETVATGEFGAFRLTPTRVIATVALAFGLLDMILSGVKIPRSAKNPWLLAFFGAFALASVYGSLSSGAAPMTYLLIWIRYLSVILFYFLLCQLIATRRDLDVFMWGLVIGGCLAALSAVLFDQQPEVLVERRKGVGAGANQHAGNLLSILPMAYALFFSVRYRILKPFLVGSAGLLTLGVVLATSRSAFVAALAMGGTWMLRFRRPSDLKYVAAMILAFGMGVMVAPAGYVERLLTIGDAFEAATGSRAELARADKSSRNRLEGWRAAVGAFVSSPFGAGVAGFGPWAVRNGYPIAADMSVHNAVLQAASSMGIIGLVPYVAILMLTWTDLSKAQRVARALRSRGDPEVAHLYLRAVMVQIGFIGIAVVAQFQPGLIWKGMWAMFGLSTVVLGLTERRARELRAADPGWSADALAPGRLHAEPA